MKFEILAGLPYSANITVSDGLTGVVLDSTDTGTMQINSIGMDKACVMAPKPMTIVDAQNGVFNISLTAAETSTLIERLGFREDRLPSMQNYIGVFEFTLTTGIRSAVVPIYVQEVASCQTAP